MINGFHISVQTAAPVPMGRWGAPLASVLNTVKPKKEDVQNVLLIIVVTTTRALSVEMSNATNCHLHT